MLTSQSPLRRRIPRPSASHPHLHSTAFSHRPASSSHLAPIPCWPRPLVGLLWGGKPRASAPQAPTAEGPVAGRGELQGQDGAELLQPCQKYMDFCCSHEAHPVKNHHLRVPSLFSPSALSHFRKRCCSLNVASFSQLKMKQPQPWTALRFSKAMLIRVQAWTG